MSYEWDFPVMWTKPVDKGLFDVVSVINWSCTLKDDSGESVTTFGTVQIAAPDPAAFVAFELLTKDQVKSWSLAALGNVRVAEIEALLDNQLFNKLNNQKMEIKQAPWLT